MNYLSGVKESIVNYFYPLSKKDSKVFNDGDLVCLKKNKNFSGTISGRDATQERLCLLSKDVSGTSFVTYWYATELEHL